MNYFLAIILGAVQGITEFLPVSSTGHLIIFEKLFHVSQTEFGLAFDASLHLGTLIAVVIFFFKDYLNILKFKDNLWIKLIIGTIPAVILGLFFEKIIENNIRDIWIIGVALIAFSFVMVKAENLGKQNKTKKQLNLLDSLIIGFSQSLALIPGISRSGATISTGLFLGMTREEAAKFAFMLSGPIIAGAGLKKFLEVLTSYNLNQSQINFFLAGMMSSFVFGYLTIKYFLIYLSKNNMNVFVTYRVILGIILIISALIF